MSFLVFKLYFNKAIFKKKEEHRLRDLPERPGSSLVPSLAWPRQVPLGLSVLICEMELLRELWEAVGMQ